MFKKVMIIVLLALLGFFLCLFTFLEIPFDLKGKPKEKDLKYEYVMRDVLIDKNPKVTQIAMLGAHDAFTSEIRFSSKVNQNEVGIVTNKAFGVLAKGLVVRMSKTQNASCEELLYSGVRYLDARVSYLDGQYYTVHAYRSNLFKTYLQDVVDFLYDHQGEFIIFDIQDFFTQNGKSFELPDEDYEALFEYIATIKNKDQKSLLDYVYYDAFSDHLEDLTYNDVTLNKSAAGVIILTKSTASKYAFCRDGDATDKKTYYMTIRSYWHEDNGIKNLISDINKEYNYLKENPTSGIFVVNQAIQTGFLTNAKIFRSFANWSVLEMARKLNKELVKDEVRFKNWLSVMPIFMTDYTTSRSGNFNELANKYILEYNQSL